MHAVARGKERVLQVDRTTHGFAAGVQPARNLNPGGAAADLARELSIVSSSAGMSGQQALFAQRERRFFRSKQRPSTASGSVNPSRSMCIEGTWNDPDAEVRGTGVRRPASAGGLAQQASYSQEHHPFETSFKYAPPASAERSFWGNAAATHPGIEDEDMPDFGLGGNGSTGRSSGHRHRLSFRAITAACQATGTTTAHSRLNLANSRVAFCRLQGQRCRNRMDQDGLLMH